MLEDDLKDLGFKNLNYLMNPGIYVLLWQGEVVYVGQTTNMLGRLDKPDHRDRNFDKIYFVKCNLNELDRLEALMITKLKPQHGKAYNFSTSVHNSRGKVLGLPGQGETSFTMEIMGTKVELKGRRRI